MYDSEEKNLETKHLGFFYIFLKKILHRNFDSKMNDNI